MTETATIIVYTRPECHLCADAIETIRDVSEAVSVDVTLELVDVDERPELRTEYRDRVPYVFVDGRPAFKYRVDEAELRERLTG